MNIAYLATNLKELASTAGVVTLQGMLTIFLVLVALWLAIEIMHRLIHGSNKKSKTEAPKAAPAAPAQSVAPVAATAAQDDGAIIAAITAAILAARADEGNTSAFRVVSFKRAESATARRKF